MERLYDIAGILVKITGEDSKMKLDDEKLETFRIKEGNAEHDVEIHFKVVDNLKNPEGICVYKDPAKCIYQDGNIQYRYIGAVNHSLDGAYMHICKEENKTFVEVRRADVRDQIISRVVLTAMAAEHLLIVNQGFILHSSYIERNGKAILFTAPSGTGKSTQADLWNKLRGTEIINGDKTAVRWNGENFEAWGIPFAGSSGICKKRCIPIDAIVYLTQSRKTSIEPLKGIRAFQSVWEGCSINSWDKDDVGMATETVMRLLENVPVYHLSCTPDESAVIALETMLK